MYVCMYVSNKVVCLQILFDCHRDKLAFSRTQVSFFSRCKQAISAFIKTIMIFAYNLSNSWLTMDLATCASTCLLILLPDFIFCQKFQVQLQTEKMKITRTSRLEASLNYGLNELSVILSVLHPGLSFFSRRFFP
jgi:hypothetical protein